MIADRLGEIAPNAVSAGLRQLLAHGPLLADPGGGAARDPILEASTALGFVAARTTRIRPGPLREDPAYYRSPEWELARLG